MCTSGFRAGNGRKRTKIFAWFNCWKMIEKIKWFKGASSENYWFAAILTSGFIKLTLATTATSIGSLDSLEKSQRSITCGLLKVSRKGFEVFLLFAFVHAASSEFTVASFRRSKMKWATIQAMTQLLTADLHLVKT